MGNPANRIVRDLLLPPSVPRTHEPRLDQRIKNEDKCSICKEPIQYCDKHGKYHHFTEDEFCPYLRHEFGMPKRK